MLPLQTKYQFMEEPDTTSIILFVLILGGFIIFLILGNLIGSRKKGTASKKRKQYSHFVFSRLASNYRLNHLERDLLIDLIKNFNIKDPYLIFSDPRLLDDLLRKGLIFVEGKDEWSENQKETRKVPSHDKT